MALGKASAVGNAGEIVLAADTVVMIDQAILGKPRDPADARRMLQLLQGREHRVLSGVALREVGGGGAPTADRETSVVEESAVRLRALDAGEIAWYVDTGEPADKAGAYALQGIGGLFVERRQRIELQRDRATAARGLRALHRLGYDLRDFPREPVTTVRALDRLPRS